MKITALEHNQIGISVHDGPRFKIYSYPTTTEYLSEILVSTEYNGKQIQHVAAILKDCDVYIAVSTEIDEIDLWIKSINPPYHILFRTDQPNINKFEWEPIGEKILRTLTPQGWLVKLEKNDENGLINSICHVPDPEHIWSSRQAIGVTEKL